MSSKRTRRHGKVAGAKAGLSATAVGARQRGDGDLIRALDHKRRREIMRFLNATDDPVSAGEIGKAVNQPRGTTCHHLRILRQRGLVALAGANEHTETFYLSRVRDRAAVKVFLDEESHG